MGVTGLAMGQGEQVTVAEAARILGLHPTLVVRRMNDGRLPCRDDGAGRTCGRADVEALAERERSVDRAMRDAYEEHAAIEDAGGLRP